MMKAMDGRKKITLIFGLAFLFVFAVSAFVFAQRPLEVEYPTVEGVSPETTAIGLPEYVKYIFNFSLGIAGLIVFAALLYAGLRYLTSAGNPSRQKDAKDWISAAFLGLLVLLLSYLILTTINPQLIILNTPGKVPIPLVPIIGVVPPGESKTLYFTEIPAGAITEQLFLKERLLRIKDVSESLRLQAEKVKILSEELEALTKACNCALADKGTCSAGSCGGNRSCVSSCRCTGDPRGRGDPCPSRATIDQKREELKLALSEKEAEKGLEYWRKEFEKEIIDFRRVYNDLLASEQSIKDCSGAGGRAGSMRELFGYRELLTYRDKLKEDGLIDREESDPRFSGYNVSDTVYELATFYCVEMAVLPIDLFPEEIVPLTEDVPAPPILCGEQIPIGEAVDNAEELARRMLAEMDSINSNTSGEITSAWALYPLPESCKGSNCSNRMKTNYSCCGCCPPPAEGSLSPYKIIASLFPPIKSVYAQGECTYGCCEGYACTGCSCTVCAGQACPYGTIESTVLAIQNYYNEIRNSRIRLIDLIEERVERRLRLSVIFATLDSSQQSMGACYNPKSRYDALELSENTIWEYLYSCSKAREFLDSGYPLLYEAGKGEIRECYGHAENPDLMDNFFCCFSQISP